MQAGTPTSSTASRRMPDGKEWMTTNLNVVVPDSYCEWRLLVKQYGGVRDDSEDGGKAAFPRL